MQNQHHFNIATLVAVFVMILVLPMMFKHGSNFLYPFVLSQWGRDLGEIAFWCAWIVIVPTLFVLLRSSLNSSFGMLAVWVIERFVI